MTKQALLDVVGTPLIVRCSTSTPPPPCRVKLAPLMSYKLVLGGPIDSAIPKLTVVVVILSFFSTLKRRRKKSYSTSASLSLGNQIIAINTSMERI